MNELKKGDWVIVRNADHGQHIKNGERYKVVRVEGDYTNLDIPIDHGYYYWRFEKEDEFITNVRQADE